MQVVNEVAFANVPSPSQVQVIPVLLDALEPAVIFTAPASEQVLMAVPAVADGAVVTVTVTSSREVLSQPETVCEA